MENLMKNQLKFEMQRLNLIFTCAYAPYAPNWLKTKGLSKFMWPAICCIRRNCRSFSVSANLTTKLEDAPWLENENENRNEQFYIKIIKIHQKNPFNRL